MARGSISPVLSSVAYPDIGQPTQVAAHSNYQWVCGLTKLEMRFTDEDFRLRKVSYSKRVTLV